jgi:hypothetical protein
MPRVFALYGEYADRHEIGLISATKTRKTLEPKKISSVDTIECVKNISRYCPFKVPYVITKIM